MSDLTLIDGGQNAVTNPPMKPIDPAVTDTSNAISWEDIKSASDIELLPIPVPEWGKMPDGSPKMAYLKMLTAREAIDLTKRLNDPKMRAEGMLEIVHRTLVNPVTLQPIVPASQIEVFAGKAVKLFTRLQKAALEMNGMVDDKKDAEEVKNA